MPQTNTCVTNGNLPPDIYTANLATQLTYNINFDFEAEADVVVYREQPAGTFTLLTNSAATGATPPNYTINEGVSPAQVTFNTGEAPGGVSLLIGRRTGICDPIVTFQVGAAIRAGDLNASNTQLLHLIQEMRSTLGFMINGNDTDPIIPGEGMDLNDLDDVNVGDPVDPDPALLRYNGTDWVGNGLMESGYTAWTSDNSTFATTAAGDQRWLNAVGGNVIGGDGINVAEAGGNITISVDLDDVSGLEFDGGELRIDTNLGCEIVADGLNTQTTAASVVQTGGTNNNPAIRISETLGATTTNTDLTIIGGANTTVTRDNNGQLTIESSGGVGTTYRGTVDVTDNATLPTDSNVNDLFANDTQGTQTANWQTVITGASTTANAGDLLLCTTAAGGTATDARYTLIESGTPESDDQTLQEVTTNGNTTTNAIILDDTSLQIQEGADTLTVDWPTGTADRTISFPDAGGTVALAGDVPAAANDGQINIAGGNGITATGNNATANQAGNTTRTLTVEAADNTINVAAGGISVNAANLPVDARYVAVAGDTMTGNLQMDGASVIADNAETIPNNDDDWDIQDSNVWQFAGGTIEFPDTDPIPGQTGIIVLSGAVTAWATTTQGDWHGPDGTPPAGAADTIIPFYVRDADNIWLGAPTTST